MRQRGRHVTMLTRAHGPVLPSDGDKDLGCVNPGPSEPFILFG